MDLYGFHAAFHFQVVFLNLDNVVSSNSAQSGGLAQSSEQPDVDTRFQSVSGLGSSIETDSIVEGGENRFKHLVPKGTTYTDLVLKRGLVRSSKVIEWCKQTMGTLQIQPLDINVSLLNEEHQPVVTWQIKHAWPKKWAIADFNAESSAIVIETLELGYQFFTVDFTS